MKGDRVHTDQLWASVQEELSFQLAKPTYDTWVKRTRLIDDQGGCYQIGVPSKLAKDWLEDRFSGLIRETLQAVLGGGEIELDFVVVPGQGHLPLADAVSLHQADEPRIPVPAAARDQPPRPSVHPSLESSGLNERFRFSNFVVGNNSRFAHAAAKAVAEAPGDTYNPLFLYGGVGLGKTHLMQAIGHAVIERFPGRRVRYLTTEQFTNDVIMGIQKARMPEIRGRFRTVDVLLIDDIQFLTGKDRSKEEFFHTFNTLQELNKQIVISSDRPPREIDSLEDRMRSRFEQGLLVDILPPDFETRYAILKSKLGAHQDRLAEPVLTFIAHKVQKNIRELEGALTRVLAFAAIHQREVGLEEATQLLADIIPASTRRPLTIGRIQQVVADYYGISLEDMKSKRRDKHIVFPRQVAMYLIREETPSSLPVIGQAFGRDHTTALHSIDKIQTEAQESGRLYDDIRTLRQRIYEEA
ncbi:MAG: chromosomal replication initiator protein DnaA [Candidatus Dormibacteraeota bacterium]|nr:chromosomal replication initiator protein DnaA [Candidatus Dormibacteraeota bacterium]MBO0744312.1 chromosomal replication initiator protein DnaA [Candidatus Dormibacteraeota bacterium]